MYDRLQLLSSGLESLPKVTPPYSIVDSILPRLAELAQSEGNAETAAAEAVQETVSEPGAPRRLKRERRWTDRFSMRALGGVVAAGIVASLFLVTYNNSGSDMNNAQEAEMSASADSAAADSGVSALREQASLDSVEEPKAKISSDEVSTSSADASTPQQDTGSAQEDIYRSTKQDGQDTKNGSNGQAASGASEDSSATSDSGGNSPNQTYTIVPERQPNPSIAGDSDKSDVVERNDEQKNSAQSLNKDDSKMLGISQFANEFVSPDGHYKAALDPDTNTLSVYVQADMTFVMKTESAPGGIGVISWAEDSKSLTYAATAEDGSSQTYKVDVEAGTITPVQNTP